MDFSTVKIGDSKYHPLLREINDAPEQIYVRGSLPNRDLPTVAVVGTRKATKDGRELARRIGKELASAGVVVVSGLAMGVDTEAHRGALDAEGVTLAVLGNGIDSIYPAQNEGLARKILDSGGAVISEYGPGEPSFPYRFIERNRIISGLSIGVVVIEAPERSGAISTARFAGEQGRSVFVFPSSPNNKNYKGSHELIRDGATLVTNTADILDELGIGTSDNKGQRMRELGSDEYKIVRLLEDAGRPLKVDIIIEQTTLEPHVASNIITILVIEGIIKETNGGYEISNS